MLTKMRSMRLLGMAQAFQQSMESGKNEKFTSDEMITHLIESEWDDRHNRKMNRTVKDARFRYKASIEQITFEDNRVDKNQIHRLADCNFIKRHENIIITGSTGIGKSYLASAIGDQAGSVGDCVLY